jgi:hypothetical protein
LIAKTIKTKNKIKLLGNPMVLIWQMRLLNFSIFFKFRFKPTKKNRMCYTNSTKANEPSSNQPSSRRSSDGLFDLNKILFEEVLFNACNSSAQASSEASVAAGTTNSTYNFDYIKNEWPTESYNCHEELSNASVVFEDGQNRRDAVAPSHANTYSHQESTQNLSTIESSELDFESSISMTPDEFASLLDSACVSLKPETPVSMASLSTTDVFTHTQAADTSVKSVPRVREKRELNRAAALRYRVRKMQEREKLFLECELYRKKIEKIKKNIELTLVELSDLKSEMLQRCFNMSIPAQTSIVKI